MTPSTFLDELWRLIDDLVEKMRGLIAQELLRQLQEGSDKPKKPKPRQIIQKAFAQATAKPKKKPKPAKKKRSAKKEKRQEEREMKAHLPETFVELVTTPTIAPEPPKKQPEPEPDEDEERTRKEEDEDDEPIFAPPKRAMPETQRREAPPLSIARVSHHERIFPRPPPISPPTLRRPNVTQAPDPRPRPKPVRPIAPKVFRLPKEEKPACPGPDCPLCNGTSCIRHGENCSCETLERHYLPRELAELKLKQAIRERELRGLPPPEPQDGPAAEVDDG